MGNRTSAKMKKTRSRKTLVRRKSVSGESNSSFDSFQSAEPEKNVGDLGNSPLWQDLKVVIPFWIGMFALTWFVRSRTYGLVFGLFTVTAGMVVYYLFQKWNLRRMVSLELYRLVLVFGVIVILSQAFTGSKPFWPDFSIFKETVEVSGQSALLRLSPNINSEIIAYMENGERLLILESHQGWYKVKTDAEVIGWVPSSLVR